MSKRGEPIVVLVCGGRTFDDRARLFAALDSVHDVTPIRRLVQGGADGADRLARIWARERGVPCDTYEADWAAHGRAAGPKRNERMLVEARPDLVLAMPGGAGTADMVRRARRAGVTVVEDR